MTRGTSLDPSVAAELYPILYSDERKKQNKKTKKNTPVILGERA